MATPEEMDVAAEAAARELEKLDPHAVKVVADWWLTHFKYSGHKRLGRLIVGFAKDYVEEV